MSKNSPATRAPFDGATSSVIHGSASTATIPHGPSRAGAMPESSTARQRRAQTERSAPKPGSAPTAKPSAFLILTRTVPPSHLGTPVGGLASRHVGHSGRSPRSTEFGLAA